MEMIPFVPPFIIINLKCFVMSFMLGHIKIGMTSFLLSSISQVFTFE